MKRFFAYFLFRIFNMPLWASITTALVAASIFGLMLTRCSNRPVETDICILYTTDVYGNILPYDFVDDSVAHGLAQFATLIKEQRAKYANRVILLDNGNRLSRGVVPFYYNFIDSIHEPLNYRADRMIGYDATGVGIHDPEYADCLHPTRHNPKLQPPVVCANLVSSLTGEPIFKPYVLIERDGIRIAVLAMISPAVSEWIPADIWHDVETLDMIECAQKWVPYIQQHLHPDLLIGLFSCSDVYEYNDVDANTYKNPNGGIPAALATKGFDLLLLSGSKTPGINYAVTSDGDSIPYMSAGKSGESVGMSQIHLSKSNDGKYTKHIKNSIVRMSDYAPDPAYCEAMKPVQDSLYQWFNTPFGFLKDDIYGGKGLWGPDFYRDLINTAQLEWSGADISLAFLTIPHDTIKAGPVSMKTIFNMYSFSNDLMNMSMNGDEVKRMLEWGYSLQFEQMTSKDSPLLRLQKDSLGNVISNSQQQPYLYSTPNNFIAAGGINYTVDLTKRAGDRVSITHWHDGTPFDPRKLYHVVVNNHCLTDEGGFISNGMHWDKDDLALHALPTRPNSIRLVLRDYFMNHDTVRFNYRYEWNAQPNSFWETAKLREQKTLNPTW